MANKLKDNFSSKPFELNIKLNFNDKNEGVAFGKALETVWSEGKAVKVDGKASIEANIKDGNNSYPCDTPGDTITNIIVAPSKVKIELPLEKTEINSECKKIVLYRWYTNDRVILESPDNASIYFKMEFVKGTNKSNFTFKQQPNKAKNIQKIVEEYDDAIKFLNNIFIKQDTDVDDSELSNDLLKIKDMRKAISTIHSLYSKLYEIESAMKLSFNPEKIVHNDEFYETIEEIYSLIVDKKIIRMQNTFKDFQNKEMSIFEKDIDIDIGNTVLLTFVNQAEYELLNEKIVIYTANALWNAVVVDIRKDSDKIQSVKYEGSESKPMYISYSGFMTEEDAVKEQQRIVQKITEYQQAKTLFEYINC
ncbi:MAG TPA: hypothetical protein DCM73_04795 [Clostridiales bacterium]|nr:hypothetical protein [Clostridiales bacterium]